MSEKESSVLFNLKELMNLEEDRIAGEEQARLEAEEAERARIAAEEKARREAEEARIEAERAAAEAAERARIEEEERRVREAEEAQLRVRLEAEAAAKREEQARLLAHEQKMAAIEAEKKKGLHPGIIVGIVFLLLAGGVGAYFGVIAPELEAQQAATEAAERRAAAEREAAARQAEELAAQTEAALAESRRAAAAAAEAQRQAAEASANMSTGGTGRRHRRGRSGTTTSGMTSTMRRGSPGPLDGLNF